MSKDFWQKIEEIFPLVADLPASERERRLRELCAGDEDLRREISALLAADAKAADFYEIPVVMPKSLSRSFSRSQIQKTATLELAGQKIGAYRIVRKISSGGMGAVYLAERADGAFDKKVAVKLVKNGSDTELNLRRFRHERQILADLEHPNIARLIDGGTTASGAPYFVMEYVEGETLFDYCSARGLDLLAKLQLFQQICAAVAYAHDCGVIHRDLKPGNILVTESGAVKLLDFGIAKIFDADSAHYSEAQTATLMRQMTPEYASPEQIKGEKITPASDVYSLGVVLYELLTGERPYKFPSRSPHEIARVICEQEVQSPKFKHKNPLSDDLSFVVLKTLRKQPSERYESVADLNRDIERFLAGLPVAPVNARNPFLEKISINPDSTGASLAVAPFKIILAGNNEIADTNKDFLGIGLADALTTTLSGVRGLSVRPTSSVLRLAAKNDEARALGEELGVDYILEGHILRAGEQIRVSAQLLKIKDDSVLWAAQFDESETDIFQLQDSISKRVADSLLPRLTNEEQEVLRRHGTANAAAYEAYLRGRVFFHNYTFGGISAAENCFEQAIALDPNFALAYCGLADFYNLQTIFGLTYNQEGFARAKETALKAIELDPNLADAYAALAFTTWAFDWDFAEAERIFKKAIRLNPNYPRAHEWFAFLLSLIERHEEAIAEMQLAEQLDPNSPAVASMYSLVFYNARRYEESLKKARRALELDPNYYIALQSLGWICPRLGKFDEAIESCRRAVLISDAQPLNKFSLALALIDAGQTKEAREIAAELEVRRQKSPVPAYYLGLIYAKLGEDDKAFDWLEEAIRERGYYTLRMRVEPRLDHLRGDSRFARLLAAIKPLKYSKTIIGERAIPQHHKTQNAAAYEAYSRGRAAAYAYTFEGVAASEKFFQEAISHDSDFAAAYSGLADFYNWQTIAGLVPPATVLPAAKQAARRALELDSNSSEAHASLAFATWAFDWDFAESERLYRKAIGLNPKNAKAREWFSYLLSSMGRHDEAIAEMQRVERLDENSPTVLTIFGLCFHNARRYREGYEKIKRALELDPNYYLALQSLGWLCPPLGKFDEAITGARRAVEINDELAFNKFSLALALIAGGRQDEAGKIATELEKRRRDRFAPAYCLALIYANLGENNTAFRWLDEAIKERGYWTLWLNVEPRFDVLRKDRRFAGKLKTINFPDNSPKTADSSSPQTDEVEAAPEFKIQMSGKFKARAAVFTAIFGTLFFAGIYAVSNFNPVVEKNTDRHEPAQIVAPLVERPVNQKPRTSDAVADELYQAGKQQLDTRSLDAVNRAIKLFGEATKRDPNFALAFSGLADAHIVLADKDKKAAPIAYRTAEEYALKALALDPDLAEARTSLAMTTYKNTGNLAVAEKQFLRAIEINPSLPRAHHWYSQILRISERNEEALREIKIAAELDPKSAVIHYNVGIVNLLLKRLPEAIAYFDKAIELDAGFTSSYLSKSIAQQMLGDYNGALDTYRIGRIYNGKDENEPLWILMQAQTHAAQGRREDSLALLNRLLQNPARRDELLKLSFDVALVYALLNDAENACRWLEKIKAKEMKNPDLLKQDPRLTNLHDNELFNRFLEKRRKLN